MIDAEDRDPEWVQHENVKRMARQIVARTPLEEHFHRASHHVLAISVAVENAREKANLEFTDEGMEDSFNLASSLARLNVILSLIEDEQQNICADMAKTIHSYLAN